MIYFKILKDLYSYGNVLTMVLTFVVLVYTITSVHPFQIIKDFMQRPVSVFNTVPSIEKMFSLKKKMLEIEVMEGMTKISTQAILFWRRLFNLEASEPSRK